MPATPIGDAVIMVGADLSQFSQQVNKAIGGIKPINLKVTTGGGGRGGGIGALTGEMTALEKAQLRAAVAGAELAAKQKILQQALLQVTPGTVSYANVLARLKTVNEQVGKAAEQSAKQQASADKQLAAAKLSASLAGEKQTKQIKILSQALEAAKKNTVEYYNIQARLKTVQMQASGGAQGLLGSVNSLVRGMRGFLALEIVQTINNWTRSFVNFNAQLVQTGNMAEMTDRVVRELSVSYDRYTQVLNTARQGQTKFGGSLQANEESLSRLINFSNRYGIELSKIDNLIRRLAASDPEQGISGAAISIREALSGDTTSMMRRFEIPLEQLKKLRDQSVSVADKAEELDRILTSLGVTNELLAGQMDTNAAAFARFGGVLQDVRANLGQALANSFRQPVDYMTKSLQHSLEVLDKIHEFEVRAAQNSPNKGAFDAQMAKADAALKQNFAMRIISGFESAPNFSTPQFQFMQQMMRQYGVEADKAFEVAQRFTDEQIRSGNAMSDAAALVNAAALAQYDLTGKIDAATKALKEQQSALQDQEEALSSQMEKLSLIIRQQEAALHPYEDEVKKASDALEKQRDALDAAEEGLQPYRDAVEAAGQAVKDQQRAIDDAERSLEPYRQAVESAQEAVDKQRRAIEEAEAALKPYKDAVDAAQDAVDAQQRKIELAERALRPYEKAVKDANRAVDEQQRALKGAEKALDPYRDAVENAQQAIEAQQRKIEMAERALRPFEDAVKRAQKAHDEQARAIEAAERALRPYEDAVRSSQKALDAQKEVTDQYKEALDEQNKALEEAKQRQSEWANVPLKGSQAFSDKLFEIDMQVAEVQKKLLDLRIGKKTNELSPLEEQLLKVNDQVQATALRLSNLRTTNASQADIAAAEAAYQALRNTQDELSTKLALQKPSDDPQVKALEEQLQNLQDQAEGVRLDEKLQLDPLRRQLSQLGKTQQEMSFEDIVAGYQRSSQEVDDLTQKVTKATTEWEDQQAALDKATAAHEKNQAALEAQQAAIEPLRLQLEKYQDAVQAASDALERQQEAIQPLRDELVTLQDRLYDAQAAFDAADKALDPMRENLDKLQEAADKANLELQKQQDLIEPLKDALIPLNDALRDANEAYDDQNKKIDPLRENLGELEGTLRRAQDALEDQDKKAVQPLRDRLLELQRAYDDASTALENHDKLLDPMRKRVDALEKAERAATRALDDQRDKIEPNRRKLELLGLQHDDIQIRLKETKKQIENVTQAFIDSAPSLEQTNHRIAMDFQKNWVKDETTSVPYVVGRGVDAIVGEQGFLSRLKTRGTSIINDFVTDTVGLIGKWLSDNADVGIVGKTLQLISVLTTEGTGLFPVLWQAGKNIFGWMVGDMLGIIADFVNPNPDKPESSVPGLFGGLHLALFAPGLGAVVKIAAAGVAEFLGWKNLGLGHISDLIGNWDQKTGVIGAFHTLWDKLTEKKDTIKDAILAPFNVAGEAISGVMQGFGDSIIEGLNTVLEKISGFTSGIRNAINWVSQKIIGQDVLPDAPPPPEKIPPILAPNDREKTSLSRNRLATGTDNWGGGWATTGEMGSEVAILPAGSIAGNATYLPPGTKVLSHDRSKGFLERGQGSETDQTKTTDPADPWSLLTDSVRDMVAFIQSGPEAMMHRALEALGLAKQPSFDGPFAAWDRVVGLNFVRMGMRKAHDVAVEWLDSTLPPSLAAAVKRGLAGGGPMTWGFLPGGPFPGTSPEEPPSPVPGAGYPTGIGLATALAAIMDGAYITQHFSPSHPGIDIGGGGMTALGKAIHALIGGRVVSSGFNPALEGQYIITEDAAGRGAYYGHMVPGSQHYQTGDIIPRGATIGGMGMSGMANGPHVHFEMRLYGRSVNPEDVFSGAFKWPLGPDTPVTTGGNGSLFWPNTPATAQGWLNQAIMGASVGEDWIHGMSILGRYESGWDPRAINLWDSNAKKGYPSRGLAQTIPQTFNAWKRAMAVPYTGNFGYANGRDLGNPGDIYDPIENLIASIRYIRGNYGHVSKLRGVASVEAGGDWIGYARGGVLNEQVWGIGASGQKYMFGEEGREMILSNDTTNRLIDAIGAMDRRHAINAPMSSPVQPVVVEEHRYQIDAHYSQYQSERDLRHDIWLKQKLRG